MTRMTIVIMILMLMTTVPPPGVHPAPTQGAAGRGGRGRGAADGHAPELDHQQGAREAHHQPTRGRLQGTRVPAHQVRFDASSRTFGHLSWHGHKHHEKLLLG
jgi:hypothetical protein